ALWRCDEDGSVTRLGDVQPRPAASALHGRLVAVVRGAMGAVAEAAPSSSFALAAVPPPPRSCGLRVQAALQPLNVSCPAATAPVLARPSAMLVDSGREAALALAERRRLLAEQAAERAEAAWRR